MPFDINDARSRVADLERAEPSELRENIAALAQPRMTGSTGAEEVERELRERFGALGYDAEALGFSFSTFPGRFGITVTGAIMAISGGVGAWLLWTGLPTLGLIVLLVGLVLALLPVLMLDRLIASTPFGRADAENLLFTRSGARPQWILMAHRDSKSQLVPTLLRTLAVGAGALAWLALVVLGGLWFAGSLYQFPTAIAIAGIVVVAAGLVLALSWATNRSPGALDNATGLAALLSVARHAGETGDVAFLLTDGEELGMAGARAVVDRLPPVQGVINVDGLDDGGTIYLAEGHGWRRTGTAPQLAAALLSAGRALDLPVERRPLPRSLLVDHLPIASAGIPALTLLRGRWGSLMRVHTGADRPDRLEGRGAAEVATLLSAALRLLREEEADHLAGRRATAS